MADLVESIKKAALEAVEATKPLSVMFGDVRSVSPLQVDVGQSIVLGEKQLVIGRNFTSYTTKVKIEEIDSSFFERDGEELDFNQLGPILVTVQNELSVGDKVILLRFSGGQKFLVWDRLI